MADLRFRVRIGIIVSVWFCVFYAGTDWIMRGATDLRSVATPLDAHIPFWPWFAVLYLSVTPFLFLPLLVLTRRLDLVLLAATLMAEIVVASLVFLLFPVTDPFVPPGPYPTVYVIADLINLTRNNLPSLHVTLTIATLLAMWRHLGRLALPTLIWAALICVSTLFTHQHDLASVTAGGVLAAVGHVVIRPVIRAKLGQARV